MDAVKLAEKFALFREPWKPKIAAELNGQYVKLVRFLGPFTWHRHEEEDEMFLCFKGSFTLELRDGPVEVGEGEFVVVPAGVEHRPVAAQEAQVILFEPKGVLNTGDVRDGFTVEELERI